MKNRYRNVAFLAELLINILVFSIACAILVSLFGQAAGIARRTRDESFATTEMYAVLETMRARGEDAFEGAGEEEGEYLLFYDAQWQPAQQADSAYTLHFLLENTQPAGGTLTNVAARATDKDGNEICQMETAIYEPAGGDAA